MPNCPTFIVYYFATLKAGGTVVNYNPLYTLEELTFQVKDSETELMVTLDLKLLFDKVEGLMKTGALKRAIVASFPALLPGAKSVLFKLFKGKELAHPTKSPVATQHRARRRRSEQRRQVPEAADRRRTTMSPCCSTPAAPPARPRAPCSPTPTSTCNVRQVAAWATDIETGKERVLGALPFFHVFAMTVVMNFGVAKAAEIVIMPRFVLDDAMKLIDKTRPTVMPGVPTMFNAMLQPPQAQELRPVLAQVLPVGRRAAAARGEAAVREAHRLQAGRGLRAVRGLARRDMQSASTARSRRARSASRCPARSSRCATSAIRRQEVPLGEKGEICVKGPQVMKGYWKRPEETANQFVGEYLRTGDVGVMDEDGFIFIVDRIKDLIICSGYNVYPRRIEEAIYEHPAVEEVTVIGIKDEYRGEAPKAFIKLKAGADGDQGGHPEAPRAEDLQDRAAGRDRVPRRAAQDHDRQALQEGAQGRGRPAPQSQGQMSARQPQERTKRNSPEGQGPGEHRLYTIGELADELKVTTRAIRFYESKGLIAPARRGIARSYTRRDRARLRLILRGKNLGFSLEEIAQYLKLYDADPAQITQTQMLLARVERAIDDLQAKRADLDRTLKDLKEIRAQCAEHLKGRAASD